MIQITIFILLYIVATINNYLWVQKAFYHPKGILKGLNPDGFYLTITIIPIINVIFFGVALFESPYTKGTKPTIAERIFETKRFDK